MSKPSHQCMKDTTLIEWVWVCFRKEFWMTCWSPLMQDVFVINTRHHDFSQRRYSASPAKWIISLFSPLFILWMLTINILWSTRLSPLQKRKEKNNKARRRSSLYHFQAVDTVLSSHPVLFCGCLRQLLALEMKDACLAAFKDLHNSECH